MGELRVTRVSAVEVNPETSGPDVVVELEVAGPISELLEGVIDSWPWRAAGLLRMWAGSNNIWLRVDHPDHVTHVVEWLVGSSPSPLKAMSDRARELEAVEHDLLEKVQRLIDDAPS